MIGVITIMMAVHGATTKRFSVSEETRTSIASEAVHALVNLNTCMIAWHRSAAFFQMMALYG
jgi:hypothetical protein